MHMAWGFMVIGLGLWEALAFSHHKLPYLSRKGVPTVSATVRWCHRRKKRATRVAVGIWLMALGSHLLDKKAFEEL